MYGPSPPPPYRILRPHNPRCDDVTNLTVDGVKRFMPAVRHIHVNTLKGVLLHGAGCVNVTDWTQWDGYRYITIFYLIFFLYSGKYVPNEMGRACNTYRERKCVYRIFLGKPERKRPPESPRLRRKIILKWMLIKVQLDATVCRHLFSATSLYMFRVSCTHHQEY